MKNMRWPAGVSNEKMHSRYPSRDITANYEVTLFVQLTLQRFFYYNHKNLVEFARAE